MDCATGWIHRTAVLVLVATCSLTLSGLAQTTSCRPADSLSSRTTAELKDYVTSSDSFTVKLRNTLGITGTNANKISYNTNSTICTSAVTALNTRSGTPGRARRVYVWVVGSNYAVEDPADEDPSGYRVVSLFTSKWIFKSGWAPN
jgi:hypothetical protein